MTGGLAGIAIGALLAIGIVSVSYVVAKNNAGTGLGEFFRGFMIGFNAGTQRGHRDGAVRPGDRHLAGRDQLPRRLRRRSRAARCYQGILGWSSWLMPMSWLATARRPGVLRDQRGRRGGHLEQVGRGQDRQDQRSLGDRHDRDDGRSDSRHGQRNRVRRRQLRLPEPRPQRGRAARDRSRAGRGGVRLDLPLRGRDRAGHQFGLLVLLRAPGGEPRPASQRCDIGDVVAHVGSPA